MIDQKMMDFIRQIPKVELHLHLEGAIQPGTAIELMQRNKSSDVPQTVGEVLQLYNFRDLPHFVKAMKIVSDHMRTADDLYRVCSEMLAELAGQNVRYVEFDCALQKYLDLGAELPALLEVLDKAMTEGEAHHAIKSRLVVNLLRHHGAEKIEKLIKEILEINHPRIVAIGLSGDEVSYSQKDYQQAFDQACEAGMHRTVHAGEGMGPASVWDAIHFLHAERIDHGTRAMEDAALVKFLADKQIPLTQCLTSNIRLNIVADLAHHPFYRFLQSGVVVTLNTDDPQIFQSTLTHEYELACSQFSLSRAQIKQIVLNGVAASFLPFAEKMALELDFKNKMELL